MKKILGIRACIDIALVVIFIGGIVYALGFGLSLYLARQEVNIQVNRVVSRDMNSVSSFVDGELQRVEDIAYTLICSKFGGTQRRADGTVRIEIDPSTFVLPSEEEVFQELEHFLAANPQICGAAIGFEPFVYPKTEGKYGFAAYVTSVSGKSERLPLGQIHAFREKEWYKEAARRNAPYWSRPFRETRLGRVVTCYSLPLHGFGGRLVGVLAIDIDTEAFRKKCDEILPFKGAEVTIVDREFRFVSHPDTTFILKNVGEVGDYGSYVADDSMRVKMQKHVDGNYTVMKTDGSEAFFFFSSIKRNGWTVAIECPKEEVFGGVNRMKRDTTGIAFVSLLVMAVCMIWLFRRLQSITLGKAGIDRELQVAAGIQMSLVPKDYPAFPDRGELDVYGFLKPARSVGGDLYDYFIRDEKLYFCIGDVSGKGVPASLFMTVVVALFRNVSLNTDKPAEILTSMNETLAMNNEYCMFCTMFVGVLDLLTGDLDYCNAGHNAPVIRKLSDGGGVKVNFMGQGHNLAVGMLEDYQYEGQAMTLKSGEAIFLYTDGVTEAEDASHRLFGEEAVLKALANARKHGSRSAKSFVEHVLHAVSEHSSDVEQSDDITMLVVEYKDCKKA